MEPSPGGTEQSTAFLEAKDDVVLRVCELCRHIQGEKCPTCGRAMEMIGQDMAMCTEMHIFHPPQGWQRG